MASHPSLTSDRWIAYYQAVDGRPPRETLLRAIDSFAAEPTSDLPRLAIDLGCGSGRDTMALLKQGWRVLGIDGEAAGLEQLQLRSDLDEDDRRRLETRLVRFEDLTLPAHTADLINASFSLPFCPPDHFLQLWQTITTALKPGGRFCGQLFGDRDSWATNPAMTHYPRSEVVELLRSVEVEWFEEEEHSGKTALGEDKDWHLFHIVARRRSAE